MNNSGSSFIVAAAREVDGAGSLAPVEERWKELGEQGRLVELTIDPLAAGWDTPVAPNHFRSGCAPIDALAHADRLVRAGGADAVLIRGEDDLRAQYGRDRAALARQMAIYGDECSIPEAYTRLAHAFSRRHGLSTDGFKNLAAALFENYIRTAERSEAYRAPKPAAFEMVTDLFRKVDCANPVVDFSGALIVASKSFAGDGAIEILAVETAQASGDGPDNVAELARYDHLKAACEAAYARAGIDLPREFLAGRALLEAYTCFPVAPLGFLLASGIVHDLHEVPALLAAHEITVTGGMNLARAAWNNPALNALVVMCERLAGGDVRLGAVHGNGGLGYRQGLALLRA